MINLTLSQTLLAILLTLKPHDEDINEQHLERINRLTIIAESISNASKDILCKEDEINNDKQKFCWNGTQKEIALLLITKGYSETRFSKRIHSGKCYDNECDPIFSHYKLKNQNIRFVRYWRAKSPWQIHQQTFITQEVWKKIGFSTYESTYLAAYNAAKILAFASNRCGGWNQLDRIERGMALYATGKSCKWTGTKNRMWLYNHLITKSYEYDTLYKTLADNEIIIDLNQINSNIITLNP